MSQKIKVVEELYGQMSNSIYLLIYVLEAYVLVKRSGGGWGENGWLWVENEMKLASSIFTKEQIKHKWDWMKDQWKLWKDLEKLKKVLIT